MRMLLIIIWGLLVGAAAQAGDVAMIEVPMLAERVQAGTLPPVAQRIPAHPRITDPTLTGREIGQNGGTLRMLVGDQRDLRLLTLNGYTRLLVFDETMQLVPDLLESYEVSESRIFTLHLRPGHKWSDGQPFTSEDFSYFWDHVANNKKLYPEGPPQQMLARGKPPKFEVLDATTVRYSWDTPNPSFLPALAGAQPLYLYQPAHYLKQFHEHYAEKTALAAAVKAGKVKDWVALHERRSRAYRQENPALPTLDPWHNTTAPPSEYFLFERNPFFHRIDAQGHQLPYLDHVRLQTATGSLVAAKAASGDSDLQALFIRFDSYTFLKEAETRGNFHVNLWSRGEGAFAALVPNLNTKDLVWRRLLNDARFRRALSTGIDRHDINRVIFFGLAQESNNTVIPASPLFRPFLKEAWTKYDPDLASYLLDEVGLDQRDSDGMRLLPDGRRAEITVETAGESNDETDMLELIADDYRKLGLRIVPHSSQREVFRARIISGQTIMAMSSGLENAIATPDMEPSSLAPSSATQMNWPQWGLNVESGGMAGEPVTDPSAQRLITLLHQWRGSVDDGERRKIWTEMLEINANQVFVIGVVNRIPQPVIVSNRLHNVPKTGTFAFEPGAYFGMYRFDMFFLSDKAVAEQK